MTELKDKLNIVMAGQKQVPSRSGGVEIVVEQLSTNLVKLGHNVTLLNRSYKKEKSTEYKGIKIVNVKTINFARTDAILYAYRATLKVKKMGKKNQIDVAHFHAEGPCAFLWLLPRKKKRNYKIVVTIHGIDWQRGKWKGFGAKFLRFAEKQIVKYADEIIVLSKSNQEYFRQNYNIETTLIPNGIDVEKKVETTNGLDKFNLKKNEYICCVARIVPEKGITDLIKAWENIDGKTRGNKKLVIVGGEANDKDYYNEVMSLAKKDDSVVMTGFLSQEVKEIMSNAYLYVSPSLLEGMSISILEAVSYGLPILVSDIKENTDIVGEYGYTFKVGDVSSLQEKLTTLLKEQNLMNTSGVKIKSWKDITLESVKVYKRVK